MMNRASRLQRDTAVPAGISARHSMGLHALALGLSLLVALPGAEADVFVGEDASGAIVLTNLPSREAFRPLVAEPAVEVASKADALRAPGSGNHRRERFASLIRTAAQKHGVSEALLHAVIEAESNYNPQAVSPKGATGLMQLMPITARHLGITDAFDPAVNVMAGARYLKQLMRQFGDDLRIVLAAYNAGPGTVLRNGKAIPPIDETQRYVPKVLRLYERNLAAL